MRPEPDDGFCRKQNRTEDGLSLPGVTTKFDKTAVSFPYRISGIVVGRPRRRLGCPTTATEIVSNPVTSWRFDVIRCGQPFTTVAPDVFDVFGEHQSANSKIVRKTVMTARKNGHVTVPTAVSFGVPIAEDVKIVWSSFYTFLEQTSDDDANDISTYMGRMHGD